MQEIEIRRFVGTNRLHHGVERAGVDLIADVQLPTHIRWSLATLTCFDGQCQAKAETE